MTEDARFEDGGDRPLRLRALDDDDLKVMAGLCQDAVLTGADMAWRPHERRLALLLNRFRWEDIDRAQTRGRSVERVRTMLVFEDVMAVRSQGLVPGDGDEVLSLLDIRFSAGEDGTGQVELIFAGDGAVEADVEALEAVLRDVTRPYAAPSGKVPGHGV